MFELINKTGERIRNPSLKGKLNFLLESQAWSHSSLVDYQIRQLKKLLIHANRYSPFYKSYFAEHKFDVNVNALEELNQLPPINKNDLLTNNREIHSTNNFGKTFLSETSGSTGQILTFRKNEEWDSANRAAAYRGYSWYGVAPWESNVYFWGYNYNFKQKIASQFLDLLQNRTRLFNYSPKSLASLAGRVGSAAYLHGYSSMIYELADLIRQQRIQVPIGKLKMIKGTSEKIYPHYNKVVEKVFGRKMISEYGAVESGIIAFECPAGNMHINMEGVIVEEENNEIVVTNLHSFSFPIIRYKLGDYIKLSTHGHLCQCGMSHTILEDVEGRVGKNIYGINQKYPSLTFYYIFKNLFFNKDEKLNYQCIQSKKGELKVLIKESYTKERKILIEHEFQKYFGDDLAILIEFSANTRLYDSKLRDFISEID
jgi:phenylacetate-CoA ligase